MRAGHAPDALALPVAEFVYASVPEYAADWRGLASAPYPSSVEANAQVPVWARLVAILKASEANVHVVFTHVRV